MRPGAVAAVALVCALLGGSTALVVGKTAGWIDDDAETVVLTAADGATATAAPVAETPAKPLPGNDFDPAEIYRTRAEGVVTIIALFGGHGQEGQAGAAQGSGFVVSDKGYVLTNSHVITTAGEGSPEEQPDPAGSVFVEFRDGDRVPAKITGWDIFDDVGLLKVDPDDHDLTPVPLGDSGRVVVGGPADPVRGCR